jgi:hypothetical protein
MNDLSGTMIGALAGGAIGVAIAAGLFLLRKEAFGYSVVVGWASLSLLACVLLVGLGLVVRAQSRGGDAAMNSLILLFVEGIGFVLICVLALGIALSQGVRMGHPLGQSWVSGLTDFVLLYMSVMLFLNLAIAPQERSATDTWWQKELARRKQRENMKEAIPPLYREITVQRLDFEAQMRRQAAQVGQEIPRAVPQDVENKLRNYHHEIGRSGPIPDRFGYERVRQMRTSFLASLAIAWLLTAVSLPSLAAGKRAAAD